MRGCQTGHAGGQPTVDFRLEARIACREILRTVVGLPVVAAPRAHPPAGAAAFIEDADRQPNACKRVAQARQAGTDDGC
jgi:hypothetical protein